MPGRRAANEIAGEKPANFKKFSFSFFYPACQHIYPEQSLLRMGSKTLDTPSKFI